MAGVGRLRPIRHRKCDRFGTDIGASEGSNFFSRRPSFRELRRRFPELPFHPFRASFPLFLRRRSQEAKALLAHELIDRFFEASAACSHAADRLSFADKNASWPPGQDIVQSRAKTRLVQSRCKMRKSKADPNSPSPKQSQSA